MYKVQVTPLIGLPRFDGWAEVVTTFSGKAVWALSVSGEHARNVGKDLLDIISDETDSRDFDVSEFYQLVTKVVSVAAEKQAKLSLSAALLSVDEKSIFCTFDGSILLKRDAKSGVLLQSKQALQVIQGQSQLEDILVFVTKQADQFSGEVQQKLEQGFGVDSIVASITPSMHLEDSTALSALAFSLVLPAKKNEETEPLRKQPGASASSQVSPEKLEAEAVANKTEKTRVQSKSAQDTDLRSPSIQENVVNDANSIDQSGQQRQNQQLQQSARATVQQETQVRYDPFFRALPAEKPQLDVDQEDDAQSSVRFSSPASPNRSVSSDRDSQQHRFRAFSYTDQQTASSDTNTFVSDIKSTHKETSSKTTRSMSSDTFPDGGVKEAGTFEAQQQLLEKLQLSSLKSSVESGSRPQPVSVGKTLTFAQNMMQSLSKLATFLLSVIKKLVLRLRSSRFSLSNPFKAVFNQDVYVGKSGSRKKVAAALLVALIVVAVVGFLGFRAYQRSQQREAVLSQTQPIQERIEQVKQSIDANPIEARTNLQAAIAELESVRAGFSQQPNARAVVNQQIEEAEALYDQISGREEFNQLPVFFDGQADGRSLVVTSVGVLPEELVFFDTDQRQGAVVSVADGSDVRLFSVGGDQSVTDAAVRDFDQTLWLLAGGQILEVDLEEGDQEAQLAINASDQLSAAEMLVMFSQAAYAFNPEERTIFRFTESDDEFGDATRWIRSVPDLDFEQIVDMTIDGDIWLTTQSGEIFRLRSGNRQEFEIIGLEQPLESGLQIYTAEALENVYILESDASRVVILNKDGEFLREVTSSSLAAASEIVVNSDESSLFAVSGSTVYQVDL